MNATCKSPELLDLFWPAQLLPCPLVGLWQLVVSSTNRFSHWALELCSSSRVTTSLFSAFSADAPLVRPVSLVWLLCFGWLICIFWFQMGYSDGAALSECSFITWNYFKPLHNLNCDFSGVFLWFHYSVCRRTLANKPLKGFKWKKYL